MSRDKKVCDDMANDTLCHDTGTLIGFSEMIQRGERLQKAEVVNQLDATKPILVMHGTGDMVTDYAASKKFAETATKVKDLQFKSYDNGYHKCMFPIFTHPSVIFIKCLYFFVVCTNLVSP